MTASRIRHSVCRWCLPQLSLDELCALAVRLGIEGIDLVTIADLPVLQRHGLTCSLLTGIPGGITDGLNRPENHDAIEAFFRETLPVAAEAGCPNAVCFSGNRAGLTDEAGWEACVRGLHRILPLAERYGVTLCMELLNSRIDHPDYMADRTAWGVELCRRVGSDRFKLLYDIYHMQVMEGDLIGTIRRHHSCIGHYHTAGVPGRHEIDGRQEIHYPAVMRAIAAAGFRGFVAQEFIPVDTDYARSLETAIALCAV